MNEKEVTLRVYSERTAEGLGGMELEVELLAVGTTIVHATKVEFCVHGEIWLVHETKGIRARVRWDMVMEVR